MDYGEMLPQVLDKFGPLAAIIVALIFGPLFTLIRTRSSRIQSEIKAYELLNQFARQEFEHADYLEEQLRSHQEQLQVAQQRLSQSESQVLQLQTQLTRYEVTVQEVERLQQKLETLRGQVEVLENGNGCHE